MRKALLPLAGLGALLTGLSAQAIPQGPTTINSDQAGVRFGSPTFIQQGLPTQTARTVSSGFVRSNTLLPLGGTEVMANPVPNNLSDLSGWSRDQLQAGLTKEYDVDVAAVTRFLYSDKGEAFLSESIHQSNYTPYYSQQATSLLSWYMTTPACIQAYTAEASQPAPATQPSAAPVRGLW